MDAHDKSIEKPMLVNLSDRLVEAQRELDELTLQLALGKAEAKEKFEEIKKQFYTRLASLRKVLNAQKVHELSHEIIARLDELEKVLNSGRAEDKAMFVEQKKLILKSLKAFENEFKKRIPQTPEAQHLAHEIEHFKMKMEILRLKFELKTFAIKDDIKTNLTLTRKKVDRWVEKARKKVRSAENNLLAFTESE